MDFSLATIVERLRAHGVSQAPGESAQAAVATLLRQGVDGAEVLFIKRAERAGDPWSGHVAFPGGKRESGESLLQTAIRETEEEVGVRLASSAFVARLDDVQPRSGGYDVAHFVFAPQDTGAPLATSIEVAATLWVSLDRLARLEGAGTVTYMHEGITAELPCLRLGDYVLWGMTYRMVMHLLEKAAAL